MDPAVADGKTAAAIVGKADTDAGVLQGAGDAHIRAAVIVNVFYGFQRFDKSRRRVGNLPVGQDFSRTDGVAVSNFPGIDAGHFSQFI